MFMVMANTKTGRDLDREYRLRAGKEAEEQKMLDQFTALEEKRKANADGLQDETKEQMTKSLLGAGVDQAAADVMTPDFFDAILRELDIQRENVAPRLLKAKLLKDITGAEQVKGGDKKVNYDFAKTMAKHIYDGKKLELIKLIPPNDKLIEIKTSLLAAIKRANFKEYHDFGLDGLDMYLQGQLDQPTLFVIFSTLYKLIYNDLTTIEESIDEYNQKKNNTAPSNAIFLKRT